MRKILLIVLLVFALASCFSTRKETIKIPKGEKDSIGSKKQIKKFTKEFVRNLYDTTNSKDTVEIEVITQR